MKTEGNDSSQGAGVARLLTREELAEVLKISVRTVDAMVGAGEIPHLRMRGNLVRFYLPDVVRHLTATALTRKRGRTWQSATSVEGGSVDTQYPRRAE